MEKFFYNTHKVLVSIIIIFMVGLIVLAPPAEANGQYRKNKTESTGTGGGEGQYRGTMVTGVQLDSHSISLKLGETKALKATVNPTRAKNKKVKWTSSNTTVATVSASGIITAKNKGKVTITVTTEEGKKTDTCTVTVIQPVTAVTLNKEEVELYVNDTIQLRATIKPNNASNKNVTWKSTNKNVATVSSSGKVTAKGIGLARIQCTANDGSGQMDTCTIRVYRLAEKVELNSTNIMLRVGEKYKLEATVSPSNGTHKDFTWKSSNNAIVEVSESGEIIANKSGTATITVQTTDGSRKEAKCKVTVQGKNITTSPLIQINRDTVTLTVGESIQLSVSGIANSNIMWSNSNTNIVKVSKSGIVTAKSPGKAIITVQTKDRSRKDTCEVIVKDNFKDGKNTYNIAVTNEKLNSVLGIIKSKNLYQQYEYRLQSKCDEVANYHIYLLLGIKTANGKKVELNNPSVENLITIGDNEGTRKQYSSDKEFFKALKNNIDNGKPTRVHVNMEGGGNAGHWVTAIGYKGNGEKLTDFKFIGTYYYGLFDGGSKEVLSLYDYTLIVFN